MYEHLHKYLHVPAAALSFVYGAATADTALHTEPVRKRAIAFRSCCKCTPDDVCGVFSTAVCLALHTEPVRKLWAQQRLSESVLTLLLGKSGMNTSVSGGTERWSHHMLCHCDQHNSTVQLQVSA